MLVNEIVKFFAKDYGSLIGVNKGVFINKTLKLGNSYYIKK
ncbi:hypothetical protein F480_06980 [Bibersteinia trehalosi Y31]|uniref:Uncharacterized protein n=1 Tax=Bibersteinia trehalosi Y31 TaxID=1261658 RepID=A0A179CZG9_BIBTR|nr:hypothetical protein F480_06980 [Bibersteinia trehalosi Y31]